MLLAGVVIFQLLKTFKIQYSQKDCVSDAGVGFFINLQLYQKKKIPCKNLGCQAPVRATMTNMLQTDVYVHILVLFCWRI